MKLSVSPYELVSHYSNYIYWFAIVVIMVYILSALERIAIENKKRKKIDTRINEDSEIDESK